MKMGVGFKSSLVGYCDVGGRKKLESVQCGVEHRLGALQCSSRLNSHSRTVGAQIGKQGHFLHAGRSGLSAIMSSRAAYFGCACKQGNRQMPTGFDSEFSTLRIVQYHLPPPRQLSPLHLPFDLQLNSASGIRKTSLLCLSLPAVYIAGCCANP